MASIWTPERRARQAALIRTSQPWQQATGPRTPDGKATASRNAYKGGHWLMLRELRLGRRVPARSGAAMNPRLRLTLAVLGAAAPLLISFTWLRAVAHARAEEASLVQQVRLQTSGAPIDWGRALLLNLSFWSAEDSAPSSPHRYSVRIATPVRGASAGTSRGRGA